MRAPDAAGGGLNRVGASRFRFGFDPDIDGTRSCTGVQLYGAVQLLYVQCGCSLI